MSGQIFVSVVLPLIVSAILLVASTFSLPVAIKLRLSWVRLLALRKPRSARIAKLNETRSYLHELEADLRRQGYGPASIALHVFADGVRSLPADLTWRPQRVEPDSLASIPVNRSIREFDKLVAEMNAQRTSTEIAISEIAKLVAEMNAQRTSTEIAISEIAKLAAEMNAQEREMLPQFIGEHLEGEVVYKLSSVPPTESGTPAGSEDEDYS